MAEQPPGRRGAASGSCHLPGELQTAAVGPSPILEEGAPGLPPFPARRQNSAPVLDAVQRVGDRGKQL